MRRHYVPAALLLGSLLAASTTARAQDVAKDVPPEHWAYKAVEDLASKGLIKGYPPDGNFLGKRTLTRYEMATIIERVLARMDDLLANQKPGVSQADFDALKSSVGEIRALVDDFKTQLAVIGTDMDKVKADLDALKSQVGDLTNRVNGFDDRLNGISKKVDDTAIVADQAIASVKELRDATNAALAKKVDVGVGKLRVSGLIQVWFGSAFQDSLAGNVTINKNGSISKNNYGTTLGGRTFGGGVGDTFRLRRGQVYLIGSITPKVDYRVMFDVAKTGTGAAAPLQDLWIGYQLGRNIRAEVGQQKTGLSEEGNRSNESLWTVERSIMNELPVTTGRVGNSRDVGAVVRYKGTMGSLDLGIWDDNGADQNGVDTDRFKFGTAVAYFTGIRHLMLGVWGGMNLNANAPQQNQRDRAGATFLYQSGPHLLEAEGGYAVDRNGGYPISDRTIGLGGYVLYGHTLSKMWQLVGRYDTWDPSVHGGVLVGAPGAPGTGLTSNVLAATRTNLYEYTLGINYYIRFPSTKIQLNYILDQPQVNGVAFWGKRRSLVIANWQVAF